MLFFERGRSMIMNQLYYDAIVIRDQYRRGLITREQAKEKIKPYEDYYNNKVIEIAKKYHQKAKKFSFTSFMR